MCKTITLTGLRKVFPVSTFRLRAAERRTWLRAKKRIWEGYKLKRAKLCAACGKCPVKGGVQHG